MEERQSRNRREATEKGHIDKSSWVLNFSQHASTKTERKPLEKGLNFSDCPAKVPRADIIAGVEAALQKCKDTQRAERTRATVASILNSAKPPRYNATPKERQALTDLTRNKDILMRHSLRQTNFSRKRQFRAQLVVPFIRHNVTKTGKKQTLI